MTTARTGEYYSPIETVPRGELVELQSRRVRTLVKTAYERSAFYRRRFKMVGVDPDAVRSLSDFGRKVPTFDKEELRSALRSRKEDPSAGLYVHDLRRMGQVALTSGTTGLNTFAVTNPVFLEQVVQKMALRELWMEKVRAGVRLMCLPASWHFAALNQASALSKLGVIPIYPWGSSTGRFASNFAYMAQRYRPEYIISTPTMLKLLLAFCESSGLEARKVFDSVKYAAVAGEPLSPLSRARLRDELGLEDIFENAGSVDGMWGGGECTAHSAHHPWMDANLLEIVDPETGEPVSRGERGRVVSTYLYSTGSIYLRYDCGDLGEIPDDECECGRTHDQIEIYDRVSNTLPIPGAKVTLQDIRGCLERISETRSAVFNVTAKGGTPGRAILLECLYEGRESERRQVGEALASLLEKRFALAVEIKWLSISDSRAAAKSGNVRSR